MKKVIAFAQRPNKETIKKIIEKYDIDFGSFVYKGLKVLVQNRTAFQVIENFDDDHAGDKITIERRSRL